MVAIVRHHSHPGVASALGTITRRMSAAFCPRADLIQEMSDFFDSRIKRLMFEGERLYVGGKLYTYLPAESDWKLAMEWLDCYERKDRIRRSMLAAWKYLAQARA
jgi:hypothetical protein